MTNRNNTQNVDFRTLILNRIAELQRQDARGVAGQAIVTLDQQSVGRLNRMDALQNQAMAQAQAARRNVELNRLRAALDRLDNDEYGFCEDCGETIPDGRLRLDLAATRCISCATG